MCLTTRRRSGCSGFPLGDLSCCELDGQSVFQSCAGLYFNNTGHHFLHFISISIHLWCTNQHKKLEIKLSDTFLPTSWTLRKLPWSTLCPWQTLDRSTVMCLSGCDTMTQVFRQSEVHSDLAGFAFSEWCLSGAWLSPSSSLPVKEAICKTYPRWGRTRQAPD